MRLPACQLSRSSVTFTQSWSLLALLRLYGRVLLLFSDPLHCFRRLQIQAVQPRPQPIHLRSCTAADGYGSVDILAPTPSLPGTRYLLSNQTIVDAIDVLCSLSSDGLLYGSGSFFSTALSSDSLPASFSADCFSCPSETSSA